MHLSPLAWSNPQWYNFVPVWAFLTYRKTAGRIRETRDCPMSVSKPSDPNGKPSRGRKLIVVVHADMIGYSRLIGLDDVGTLERLRTLRSNLIDPAIDEHGGRVVNTGGDSLLIVFDSVDGAVRCAMKVQQQVPAHDGDRSPDWTIRFRVGINVGDVIPDGLDVHGDVVNVAARLQAECPPGGVCVSRAVRDHVQDRLDLAFERLGSLNLKNIARPVEAFVLKPDAAATVERSLVHKTRETLLLPDKPSIAVLAFTNMSGDPEQEYFSDGLADDIITELSRTRWLFVIARNSSFTYKGRAVDVKRIARELGVRYVLEGSVRRAGERVRVSAQLIDAVAGNHIWAERYNRNLVDVFDVQDEITSAVAHAIEPVITQAERQRAIRKPPENLDAWEAYQRGLWYVTRGNAADHEQARDFFQRAIKLDTQFAMPHAMLAFVHLTSILFGDMRAFRESLTMAEVEARRAVLLDPDNASALAALAEVDCCDARYVSALEQAERAIAVNPNDVWGHHVKGRVLALAGRPDEAQEPLLTAIRLSPRDPLKAFRFGILAVSHYLSRDYAKAAEVAQQAIRDHPDFPPHYRWLAAALGQLRRSDGAREALSRAIAISPVSFDFFVRSRAPWFRSADYEHMLDGLRKAGWQSPNPRQSCELGKN
jgi:adenylate cyclase